ncbi:MAG TPA: hypothetical protein VK892_15510, partial [Pyrinomonadaceae bacterium]|nr:hypothetical protein [Pyrinomonadaceae bacterium]
MDLVKTEQTIERDVIQIDTSSGESEIDFGEYSETVEVDSRIKYPSYKSFDEFIDLKRLRSLDGYITQRIKRHIQAQQEL